MNGPLKAGPSSRRSKPNIPAPRRRVRGVREFIAILHEGIRSCNRATKPPAPDNYLR
jgi:hypothetical protein